MTIRLRTFGGERPRTDPSLLDGHEAQAAINAKLWSGALRPFRGPAFFLEPSKAGAGTVQSIYRWGAVPGQPESGHWLNWTSVVDVIRTPIRGDTEEVTAWTGDGVPRMSYAGKITGGDLPNVSYFLGVPVPASGTESATFVGDVGDPEDAVDRTYAVTYVTEIGEEGPPLFIGPVTWYPGGIVELRNLPTGPASGSYNITNKRIYRTAPDGGPNEFYLVATIGIATGSYDDAVDDVDLGEIIPSLTWDPPPADMHSIGVMPNGICYGASKNQVCLSEAYLPHAWNPLNRYTTDHPIVGCGYFDTNVVAITSRNPHVISGITPEGFSGDELRINHGCVAKRSIVSGIWGVGYASAKGYVIIGPDGPQIISEAFFTEDEWAELEPETMIAFEYNQRLLIFYGEGQAQRALLADPRTPNAGMVRLDLQVTGGYMDPLIKSLFLIVNNDIVRWDAGEALTYRWRSRRYVYSVPMRLTAARIKAHSYADLTFRLFVEDRLRAEKRVSSDRPFRLPSHYLARDCYIELEGTDTVTEVDVAGSVTELV